jgi:hypothetical protein
MHQIIHVHLLEVEREFALVAPRLPHPTDAMKAIEVHGVKVEAMPLMEPQP